MRGNAQLGMPMHVAGADLDLEGPSVRGHHRGMQTLVVVALGLENVVVIFVGDRCPDLMDHTERGIAVLDVIYQNAKRPHVINLGKIEPLGAHLVVDAVDVLRTTVDFSVHAELGNFLAQAFYRLFDEALPLHTALVEHLRDALVGLRFEKPERQILELPLQLPDAEPVGQRCVDVETLAGDVRALFAWLVG